MPTRTTSRQAALKAKESIANGAETKSKSSAGAKRKDTTNKGPPAKRGKNDKTAKLNGGETGQEGEKTKAHEIETKPAKKTPESVDGNKSEVKRSEETKNTVPSNILEKGIIYFFFRPRVTVDDPHGIDDVARSFFVLRPTPLGATLDGEQRPLATDSQCRLMMLPKKKFPTSAREKDMVIVEKAGQSTKDLQENFLASGKYETATHGERIIQAARPYAEGVYAITSSGRNSHLVYILTIPDKLGDVQENFGLHTRGSWIVQSKNPKYPGPSFARLPHGPEYPEHVREKFRDLRWAPLEPEFIDYSNAQFLMIGEAEHSIGHVATTEPDAKQSHEEQPGEELEKLEHENEERVEALRDDDTVYEDLGLYAENYSSALSTWH